MLDARLTLEVAHLQRSGSAITEQCWLFAAELGVEIAARQLKERVGGIFLRQRADDGQGVLILLVVTIQIHGEIKASHTGSENAIGDGMLEQAESLLFRTAGNAHEKSQDSCHGAERVDIVVIKAEAKIGIREAGVESLGAKEVFASADTEAGGVALSVTDG